LQQLPGRLDNKVSHTIKNNKKHVTHRILFIYLFIFLIFQVSKFLLDGPKDLVSGPPRRAERIGATSRSIGQTGTSHHQKQKKNAQS
jgi:hypothetical protein